MASGAYNHLVRSFVNVLEDAPHLKITLMRGLNAVGRDYFGDKYAGMNNNNLNSLNDEMFEYMGFRAMNRKNMIEEMGYNANNTNNANNANNNINDPRKYTAIDDAYRHTALVNITDPYNPVVENPCKTELFGEACEDEEMFSDYVFSWKALQQMASKMVSQKRIAVVQDGDSHIWFPLLSVGNGGSRRRRRGRRGTRRTRRM